MRPAHNDNATGYGIIVIGIVYVYKDLIQPSVIVNFVMLVKIKCFGIEYGFEPQRVEREVFGIFWLKK